VIPTLTTRPTERWEYLGELVHVVDGDTVDLRVMRDVVADFGFRMDMRLRLSAVMRFRLVGVDTPESTGPCRLFGKLAANVLAVMLSTADSIRVESLGEPDKYGGRWDARIFVETPSGLLDVAEVLVSNGYAQRYDGKGPRPTWNPEARYPLRSDDA